MLPAQIYVIYSSLWFFCLSDHTFLVMQPARFLFVLINMKPNIDLFLFLNEHWVASDLLWLTGFLIFHAAHFYFTYYYYSLKKHICFFHKLVNLPYKSHKLSAFTEHFCKGFHSSAVIWKPTFVLNPYSLLLIPISSRNKRMKRGNEENAVFLCIVARCSRNILLPKHGMCL